MITKLIGVDLGGTRMRAALLDAECTILERREAPTLAQEGPESVLARLLDLIASVVPQEPVAAIGISSVGPIDPQAGLVLAPPNLPGWHEVPLRQIVQERFGLPTVLGKDANCAALAEATRGAARGHQDAIYITISTGIGGGIIVNGRLFEGAMGMAGEVGFITFPMEDGRVSALEPEAAGPAMARQAVARIKAGEPSTMLDLVGGNLDAITGKTVGEAALAGDALAVEIVRRTGHLVGCAVVTLMHLFNPTIFVIGGGVSEIGELIFEPIRAVPRQYTMSERYWREVPIVAATLGEDVGPIGAAVLALQSL